MAAVPLPLRAACAGEGGPLGPRPTAEVSTFCSCGVAIFSQRKKHVAVGLALVTLPTCALHHRHRSAQQAHPGLCHSLHGATVGGNNVSKGETG